LIIYQSAYLTLVTNAENGYNIDFGNVFYWTSRAEQIKKRTGPRLTDELMTALNNTPGKEDPKLASAAIRAFFKGKLQHVISTLRLMEH
jgi:hypothetical protein